MIAIAIAFVAACAVAIYAACRASGNASRKEKDD